MPDSSADRDVLDVLAEEFVARFRAGERPSLTEYADRLPGRADEVRAHMRDQGGVVVAGGQGQLKGQIIRVGHMGYVSEQDIDAVLAALEAAISA